MNMLQSMKIHLVGNEPLQNIILMYCLGTPTANAMKPICELAKKKRQQKEHSEDEATAWRYYKPEVKSNKPTKLVRSYLGWTITEEIKGFKIQDPDLKAQQEVIVKRMSDAYLEDKLDELNTEEKNGTPTAIIVKKYMNIVLRRGVSLMKNETMWAKFSCGEILSYSGLPLTVSEVKPEVLDDLNNALKELYEEYGIKEIEWNKEDEYQYNKEEKKRIKLNKCINVINK